MTRTVRRLVVGGGVLGALGVGVTLLLQSGVVEVAEVRVVGVRRLDPEAVRAASGIEVGTNAITLDLDAAEAAVERIPLVADANVDRDGALGIVIVVAERAPALAVVSEGKTTLVDRAGNVLAGARPENVPRLLVADGAEATAGVVRGALRILERFPTGVRTASLSYGPVHGFTVEAGPSTILLGDAVDLATKAEAWKALCAATGVKGRFDVRQAPFVTVAR